MTTMRASFRIVLIFVTGLSCGGADQVFGVPATGKPATVVLSSVQGVGGQVYASTTSVDSVNGTYETVECISGVNGPCSSEHRRTGTAIRVALDELFRFAQSREFRALRGEYNLPGDIVPPDGGSSTLTVTVGEREKTITWAKHASVPPALGQFLCRLHTVLGALSLCG